MEIELNIEKLVFGGEGLGFVKGKACFVEGALAGEKVLARIVSEKPNFSKASLLRVLKPSPHRIFPPCPYLERCGGCQYQHLAYAEELRWKELQVRESFAQAFKTTELPIRPIHRGAKDYGYRNNITIHRTTEKNNKPQRLGFIGRDNYSKVLIEHCLLADEKLKPVFPAEHKLKRSEERRGFKLDDQGKIFSTDDERIYRITIGGRRLWTSSIGFFQNNLDVTEQILKKIINEMRRLKPARFLDLYAGVGTFGLLASGGIPDVRFFEENPYSLGCLRRNIRDLALPEAGVFSGKVEKTFPRFMLQNPQPGSIVFMDPPRSGIASSLADFLSLGNVGENLFYLACDLPILVRDLRHIMKKDRYRIREIAPFDMFPRTKHIEVLVWLETLQAACPATAPLDQAHPS